MLSRLGFGIGILAVMTLASCGRPPRPISGEELLRRTVVASRSIDETGFSVRGSFAIDTLSGSVAGSGSLFKGGGWTWDGDIVLTRSAGSSFKRLHATVSLQKSGGALLLLIHDMSGLLAEEIEDELRFEGLALGRWIEVARTEAPASPSARPAEPFGRGATPDPAMVESIVESFLPLGEPEAVKRDDGGYDYSLSVLLNSGASVMDLQGGGAFKIDSRSFRLREAHWRIDRIALPLGDLVLDLELRFFDQSDAVEPLSQSGSVQIPLESILHTIF